MSDDDVHRLVELLVARSGLPASPSEISALSASAPSLQRAVERLWAVPLDRQTEPGADFRAR